MKLFRTLILLSGLAMFVLAAGFVFQVPLVTQFFWPWQDGRYSYLFIGSIFAAAGAAALWIGWTRELGALPAGSLNISVIGVTTAIYFFQLAWQGRPNMILFGILAVVAAIASGLTFLWSRRLPLSDDRPMPQLVRVSFGIFIASLLLAGAALIFHMPIFPWPLNPDSSVIFGCIFLGDAFYFLYGLFRPRWRNALGQLLSFLAYDVVLIVPFLLLFNTVQPAHFINLAVYVAVLVYSGAVAIYFLFANSQTRFGSSARGNA